MFQDQNGRQDASSLRTLCPRFQKIDQAQLRNLSGGVESGLVGALFGVHNRAVAVTISVSSTSANL